MMENLTKLKFKKLLQEKNIEKIYFDFDGTIVDSAKSKKRILVGKGDEYMPLSRAAYFKKSNKKEKKSK